VVAVALTYSKDRCDAQREAEFLVPVEEFWTFEGDDSDLWYLTRVSCDRRRQHLFDLGRTRSAACRARRARYAWIVGWDDEALEPQALPFRTRQGARRFLHVLQQLNRNAASVGARPPYSRLHVLRARVGWGRRADMAASTAAGEDPDAFAERVASEVEAMLRASGGNTD
jgi:hypothetical protein